MFVMVTCAGHKDSVTCVGFNHNSSLVVTGDMAGLIKVWSVDCCQEVWSYEVDDLEASSLPSLAGHTHTHTGRNMANTSLLGRQPLHCVNVNAVIVVTMKN